MLYFVPTPIGNLSDISYRVLDVLKCCEIALCEDTRVCKSLFALLNDKFSAQIAPKCFISLHSHNEREILLNLEQIHTSNSAKISTNLKKIRTQISANSKQIPQSAKSQIYALYNALFVENKAVAYLSDAGMPCISDPGVNLVRFAQKFGIDYEVISGANALLVAAAASGFIEKEFIFLGFLSNTGTARKNELKKALQNEYPSIIYESPKRVKALINDICEMDESREIFIIKEISKKFEKKWLGSAKNLRQILANADIKGEFTLVIAPAKKPQKDSISLNKNDIISLSLSTKEKAKLLARLGEKSVKAWYDELSSEAKK